MSNKGSNQDEVVTKITKQYLKNKTKEFDISCIYLLDLSSLGIFDLGCITECTGLFMLNLSNNKISNVSSLAPLKHLQVLDLSNNRLSSINGIDELESLSSLNLSANFISSVDSLQSLTKLEKFAHLRLTDVAKGFSNPVCEDYERCKKKIMELFPGLQTLDGQRLSGRGSEFSELCDDLDAKLERIKDGTINRRNIPLEKEIYPRDSINDDCNLGEDISHQETLIKGLLKDCEIANDKAEKTAQGK